MFLRRTTATRSEREREVATVFRRDRGEKRDGKERTGKKGGDLSSPNPFRIPLSIPFFFFFLFFVKIKLDQFNSLKQFIRNDDIFYTHEKKREKERLLFAYAIIGIDR